LKPDGPVLLVSFHDLHPGTRAACDLFLSEAAEIGIPQCSLLVVPRWHGGEPFDEDADFVAWLRQKQEQGHEILIHGFVHRGSDPDTGPMARLLAAVYTDGEGEFSRIGEREAAARVHAARSMFERLELRVSGFVAPAWLISPAGTEVLRKSGLRYMTRLNTVELLPGPARRYAPCLTFSTRSAWRRRLSRLWVWFWLACNRRSSALRIAVHPPDMVYPNIRRTLYALMRTALRSRLPSTYGRWLAAPPRRVLPAR
jgi:predicted deacetylase